MWRSVRSPDIGISHEIIVDIGLERLGVAEGRYTADRKAGGTPDIGGVRTSQALADYFCGLLLIDPILAGNQKQVGHAGIGASENQGFDDLTDLAAAGRSC